VRWESRGGSGGDAAFGMEVDPEAVVEGWRRLVRFERGAKRPWVSVEDCNRSGQFVVGVGESDIWKRR
jgi:hypothetical protein